jgi:putative membrane protein
MSIIDNISSETNLKEAKYKKIAIGISIVLPIAVAALFGIKIEAGDFSFLPPIYATINGLTALVLIGAYIAIKKKNKKLHQNLINVAVSFSLAFLAMYVTYHITSESTKFGGEGSIKYVYYTVLISHILLSIIITPFVCFTYLKGWLGNYEQHKKLTRITFPLWLYVAISGVIVYLMISPYYS